MLTFLNENESAVKMNCGYKFLLSVAILWFTMSLFLCVCHFLFIFPSQPFIHHPQSCPLGICHEPVQTAPDFWPPKHFTPCHAGKCLNCILFWARIGTVHFVLEVLLALWGTLGILFLFFRSLLKSSISSVRTSFKSFC